MHRDYFIGISIVLSTFIICGFSYDFYRTEKLLELKQFQKAELISDALTLNLMKEVSHGLSQGKTEETNCLLRHLIIEEEKRISTEISTYEFDKTKLGILNRSLKAPIAPCSENIRTHFRQSI
ncbi:hypothetical protein [Shewanella pneumatophori]|uniref:Uncharacterized protein n=1 Tax=Shewanella pneumatophori TaxID=314092 RepID=A0A9X2CI28_9GAMM|nr:hypothetical protein [Shewanella pneumatophori]MCL1139175.1 hypothetical protein [Shewanella pneumatophori]